MNLFWQFYPRVNGFGMFSLTHIRCLIILIILSYFIITYYLNNNTIQKRIAFIIGLVLLLLEMLFLILLIITNQFSYDQLPLQLCDLSAFIIFIDAIKSTKFTRAILYSLSMPGALAALIFPDWACNPIFNAFSIISFLVHTLLVMYPIMKIINKEIIPSFNDMIYNIIFLVICIPIMLEVNHLFNANFFFLSEAAPGSPLEPLQHMFGHYYILSALIMILIIWSIMYLPWINKNKEYHQSYLNNK
ncbi:MAG: YwaF family protein [Bacilli bacterium]|nr:YwaF family protein [Bacilli bacterium]